MATPVTPGGNAKHYNGERDPVNGGDVSDQCGVCNKPINEVPGEQPISCGEKQFHQSCFECTDCETPLEAGWILMHPAGGLFCNDTCMQSFGEGGAIQIPYKPGCNDDNFTRNQCVICEMPINKERLETWINCFENMIHQQCFKCESCATTPPPEGEIIVLVDRFFCNDTCIRSFGEKAVKVNYQPLTPVRVTDATKEAEEQTRGASEGKKIDRTEAVASPAIVAEDEPPAEERSSDKQQPK